MMLKNVLHTQNIVLGRQEMFLRRLEVGFHSPKAFFASTATMKSDSEISKNPFFFFTFSEFSQD